MKDNRGLCNFYSLLMFIGRVLMSIIFIYAGIDKFINYDADAAFMASKGLTGIPVLLYTSAVIEIVGGLSLILGCCIRWGAALLFLYLIPVTFLMHDFWNMTDPMSKQMNLYFFLENIAIMGGLLQVIGSCGKCCTCLKGVCNIRPEDRRL